MDSLRSMVREVADFPKPGILFRDLTPVIADGDLLREAAEALAAPFRNRGVSKVAGMEARGFIFGSVVAYVLGTGFVPLRKAGKLPYRTHRAAYALEYGEAVLEMHVDAITPADNVLLIDDLIATGGTAAASCELIAMAGARIAGCAFVIELDFLGGRKLLAPHPVHTLLHY